MKILPLLLLSCFSPSFAAAPVNFFEGLPQPPHVNTSKKLKAQWDRAYGAMQSRDYVACNKDFAAIAKIEKQAFYRASALFNQAVCLSSLSRGENVSKVEALLEQAVQLEPTMKELVKEQGNKSRIQAAISKIDEGNLASAEKLLRTAISRDPKNASAFAELAFVQARTRRFSECLESANKSIELSPSGSEAYITRGGCNLYLEKFYPALEDFNKALELSPNETGGLVNRAILHAKMGHCDLATTDAKKVIQLDAGSRGYFQNPVNGCGFGM